MYRNKDEYSSKKTKKIEKYGEKEKKFYYRYKRHFT